MQRLLTLPLLLLLALAAACSSSIPGHGLSTERPDAGEKSADAGDDDPIDDTEEPEQALVLHVTPTNLALLPNETAQASATVTSDDVVIGPEITWFSTNELVVVVDQNGLIRAIGDGEAEVIAEISGASSSSSASILVTVSAAAQCPDGAGNNGDSCASIYQGKDIWRCTVSSKLGNATVSQVCRDKGTGAKWITFHINPIDCCACVGTFSDSCCTTNSGSIGCP